MTQVDEKIFGYRINDFYLDVCNRQLRRAGRPLALTSKYFDVLLLLVRSRGRLVEKQRIFDELWQEVIVSDAALTQCIKDIRKQLGDDAANPRYIKTVPKHGYIFIGPVVEVTTGEDLEPSTTFLQSAAPRPYKFLDYYTEEDAGLFFGRETEAEMIHSQILAHRSFIIHGRSGVGKSSLLRAGLMPRLKSQGHAVYAMRSFHDPLGQMLNFLQGANASASPVASLADFLGDFENKAPGRLIIFLLDQFEDFFSLLSEENRNRFLSAIGELFTRDRLSLRLIFAVREDHLSEMSRLKTAIPEIFHHEYRLQRLGREQAFRAVTEPARAVGCEWENGLVERLIADLGDGEGIDPPQLQIVCDRLFDARDHEGRVTLEAYERLGTAAKMLAEYLERVLHRFDAADLQAAKEILAALISAGGQRLILSVAELEIRIMPHASQRATPLRALMEELAAARIVRYRQQDGSGWLELAHDFLLPEVSRWLTAEALALKRAREVITRALENHRAHGLFIDADALSLLLPFGAQLGLTDEEADLILISVIHRGHEVPEWLVHASPSAQSIITEGSRHAEAGVRLRALAACRWLRNAETEELLQRLALWDAEMIVRRNASLTLADWLGREVEDLFRKESAGQHAGRLRRSVNLALLRDHDGKLVRLSRHEPMIRPLVLLELIALRFRRGWDDILHRTVGGMAGAACAGILGGFVLGMILAFARHTSILQGTSIIVVLVSLAVFVSALGGMGVSFGMLAVSHVAYRHSRWWPILGAAAGGAFIGGVAHQLGIEIFRALFGRNLAGITGAFGGAAIGAAVALGAVMMERILAPSRSWLRIFGTAFVTMCAAIALTLAGGNLFTGSLALVVRSFAGAQLSMDSLAAMLGELHFGRTTQMIFAGLEGLLFGATVMAGIEVAGRRRKNKRGRKKPTI